MCGKLFGVSIYKEAFTDLWGNTKIFCQGARRLWFNALIWKGICIKHFLGVLSWAIWCALRHLGTRVLVLYVFTEWAGGNPSSFKKGERVSYKDVGEGRRNSRGRFLFQGHLYQGTEPEARKGAGEIDLFSSSPPSPPSEAIWSVSRPCFCALMHTRVSIISM